MIEINGNIWDTDCDIICITTSGALRKDGKTGVMGRGIALEAKQKVPDIETALGKIIVAHGNVLGYLGTFNDKVLLSFPTKHHFRERSDINLIRDSCAYLDYLLNNDITEYRVSGRKINFSNVTVAIPRPGCGYGKLNWSDVKREMNMFFSDNDRIFIYSL